MRLGRYLHCPQVEWHFRHVEVNYALMRAAHRSYLRDDFWKAAQYLQWEQANNPDYTWKLTTVESNDDDHSASSP